MRFFDPDQARPHFVYLISAGGMLKIGCSYDPRTRRHAIAKKYGGAEILATIRYPNWRLAMDAENAAHRRFGHHLLLPREWFRDRVEIRRFFRMRQDEHPHCLVDRIRHELDRMRPGRQRREWQLMRSAEYAVAHGVTLKPAALADLRRRGGLGDSPLHRAMRDAADLLVARWGAP